MRSALAGSRSPGDGENSIGQRGARYTEKAICGPLSGLRFFIRSRLPTHALRPKQAGPIWTCTQTVMFGDNSYL
jgi:hypothetical protein